MVPAGSPPAHHILGDLGIEVEFASATSACASLPVTSHLAGADGGVRAGVLAIVVDVLGGALGVRAVPDGRVATADLSLQMARPLVGPVVEARGSVLRRGRTTLVLEVGMYDLDVHAGDDGDTGRAAPDRGGDGPGPAASATVTFAVLPSRATGVGPTGPTAGAAGPDGPGEDGGVDLLAGWAFDGDGLDRPIADAISLEITDHATGAVSLDRDDYLANSFGAVQGGVIGVVADVAASTALEHVGSDRRGAARGVVIDALQIAYLAQGRVGPIVSSVHVLAPAGPEGPGGAVVTLTDAGADGRVTTVVNVSAHSHIEVPAGDPSAADAGRTGA